jgi:hypothetical protein
MNNPDNISVEKLGDGSLVYYDKSKQQIVSKVSSAGGGGGGTVSEQLQNAIKLVAPKLSQAADQTTGFLSASDYKYAKRQWVEQGLLSSDFDKSFVSFINPDTIKEYGFDQASFDSLKSSPTFVIQNN